MSFQKVRHSLIYSLADDIIDEEEFVLLNNAYDSGNALFPYREYDGFELDSLELDECSANFRANKADLLRLAAALRIPARFRCHQGTVCSGLEGLCILTKRLAYPCRYFDMIHLFARPVPAQETHTLCVFDRLPVVSWRRAKYKQMYGLKSTLTVSR